MQLAGNSLCRSNKYVPSDYHQMILLDYSRHCLSLFLFFPVLSFNISPLILDFLFRLVGQKGHPYRNTGTEAQLGRCRHKKEIRETNIRAQGDLDPVEESLWENSGKSARV